MANSKIKVSQLDTDDLSSFIRAGSWVEVINESPKNIFLAPRTDGKTGVGSALSPLNVSTATLFDNFFKNNNLQDHCVHLAPGTYLTNGHKTSWGGSAGLRPRMKLIGSGSALTIVRMATTWTAGNDWVGDTACPIFATSVDGNSNIFPDIHISGMTLDCNAQNITGSENKTFVGIYGFSVRGKLNDIVIKNSSDCFLSNRESFPFFFVGDGVTITDCASYSHRRSNTGTNTGHTIFGCAGNDMTFTRCIVDLSGSTGTSYTHAFGALGRSVFRDCIVYGAPDGYTEGFYGDTPLVTDEYGMVVEGARLYNVLTGITINSMKFEYARFINNYIQRSNYSNTWGGGAINVGYPGAELRNSIIANNIFDHVGTPNSNSRSIALWDNSPKKIQILNNISKTGMGYHITSNNTETWAFGNRYTDGTVPVDTANSMNMGFNMPGFTVP